MSGSGLTLVSETMATSSVPFVTEKFLYPVLAARPWLAYAQPGWHAEISDLCGFKLYPDIDYGFDSIQDPVLRLMSLISTVKDLISQWQYRWSEFHESCWAVTEWNQAWYLSGNYIQQLMAQDQAGPMLW